MSRAPSTSRTGKGIMADGPCSFHISTAFSIYVEMARQLRNDGKWEESRRMDRCHLVLGDRFEINYSKFRQKEEWGITPLVNYFHRSHLLTLKSAMVKRVRERYAGSSVPAWLPQSFCLISPALPPPTDKKLPPWKQRGGIPPREADEAKRDAEAFE
eukprot:Sspe_Gene.11566::Locus_3924_Transcript_1_1_Confidence_1.000_Length_673::g.11566::m.11566